ncbi:MAG: hypothetical protein JXD22_06505 [Sedimentisphaerales bacterium]|nr:hypothetical protein [Sedimentisphaerales bacterium]
MIAVVALFVCLTFYAGVELRGDDQYWYVADVESLLDGNGVQTNNYYPVHVMKPGPLTAPPFVHNILNLYFVLPAASVFGPYLGWLITNVLASILTALLLAYLVRKICGSWCKGSSLGNVGNWGVFMVFAGYLLQPLTIRQSSQPNAEATIAPLVAVMVLLYLRADRNIINWIILAGVLFAAYCCRFSFLPLLLLLPVVFLVQNRQVDWRKLLISTMLLAGALVVFYIRPWLFPDQVPESVEVLLNTAIPSISDNMYAFFCLNPMPVTLENIWLKVSTNLVNQVNPDSWTWQIFYLPFNVSVLIGAAIFFVGKKNPVKKRLGQCLACGFLLHLATVTLTQNTFRYLLVVTPAILPAAVFVVVTIFQSKFFAGKRLSRYLLTGAVLLLLTTGDVLLVNSLRQNALREKQTRDALGRLFEENLAPDETVILEAIYNEYEMLAYVLRPRKVMMVKPDYQTEQYETIIKKSRAQWLICPPGSLLLERMPVDDEPVLKDLPLALSGEYAGQKHGLYRLRSLSGE